MKFIQGRNVLNKTLLNEWRQKATNHPFVMGFVNSSEDWGWEDNVNHELIETRVKERGPLYVYSKENDTLMIYDYHEVK